MRPLTLLVLAGICSPVAAEDWPSYKHDRSRSGVSSDKLTLPLTAGWAWHSPKHPAPAWPEPGRAMNALDFDYAFQPVVAGGRVYFGSSADDTIRAFDLNTGDTAWTYTTGGPVRFAPQIDSGRCFFVSDDGHAYCVDATTGKEVWKRRLALDHRKVIAEGRLSSRWPCRSGILVHDGVAYATAGMWPSDGVFVYALRVDTGEVVWCNDTSCYEYLDYPHQPSSSFGGPAPQGPLLLADEILVVPTGRCAPAGFDAKTGKLRFFDSAPSNRGGTWATLFNGTIFTSAVAWQPDQSFRLGESDPQRVDSVAAINLRTGKEEWEHTKAVAEYTDEVKGPRWRSQIGSGLFGRQRAVFAGNRVYAAGNGRVDAFELGSGVKRLWSVEHPRVYSEALTQNALLLGTTNGVTALDPETGKTLWQAPVDGQARGLAVADGKLVVATHHGAVHTFGTAPFKGQAPDSKKHAGPSPEVARLLDLIPGKGTVKGFAVVDGDVALAEQIARQSQLHVVALVDAAKLQDERRRFVGGDLYGSRLVVMERVDRLLPYFANLVVAARKETPSGNLYSMVRPCGGVLAFAEGIEVPNLPREIPPAEVKGRTVVRGKLPGAFDWDSKTEADERVRWPLEFQWFGGPNAQLLVSRHSRPRTPVPANGRVFVFGESHITAIDAYNGSELWRRRLSQGICAGNGVVSADDEFLYVHEGKAIYQFEAATGRLAKINGESRGPAILDARKPVHREERGRQGDLAAVDIEQSEKGLRITLTAKAASFSRNDLWELAFDFRPAAERLRAPGPGTFELVLYARDGVRREHKTFPHPLVNIDARRTDDGSVIRLDIGWDSLPGGKPLDFAIAADLKLWAEDFRPRLWARPLPGKERWLNEAEAVVILEAPPANVKDVFSPQVPVAFGDILDLPDHARRPGRLTPLTRKRDDGDYSADFKEGLGKEDAGKEAPLKRANGFELLKRQQPLTGEDVSRDYSRSYGCSGTSCSAVMDFFRSGTIGMYDRLDDSGMRNISGIRSGCGLTLVPASGMLVYSESASDCLCSYSFATSLGLVPAEGRRNEDWAMFDEKNLSQGLIRRSALNLGAPGDRRDADGLLWFGFPRPPLAIAKGVAMPLPYTMEVAEGFGPFRTNSDRRPVANTDRPWIYGSGIKGLQRLRMDLTYHQPQKMILSVPAAKAPTIDGKLDDGCWDGFGALSLPDRGATVQFRADADNIYIAYEQSVRRDVLGRRIPWKARQSKHDGDFDKDDYFRISFHSPGNMKIATFAVAAGGGGYEGLMELRKEGLKDKAMPNPADDTSWDPQWTHKVSVTDDYFRAEVTVPWKSLKAAGFTRDRLLIECHKKGPWGGAKDRPMSRFAESAVEVQDDRTPEKERQFAVRLHFAELDDVQPGERVFDVQLQGTTALKDFDVVREAGGTFRAVVKEFKVSANRQLDIRLVPKSPKLTERSASILSGIEILEK